MRGISRVFLARLLAAEIEDPACAGQGIWWSGQEAAVAEAGRPGDKHAAAAEALAVCARCPHVAVDQCRQRAEFDSYTGIAGAGVYSNGRRIIRPSAIDAEAVQKAG